MVAVSRFPVGGSVSVAELSHDPHRLLARLRAAEPVSWVAALGGWLVTRHDLVRRVMGDVGSFTVDDPRFSTARVVGPSMLSLDGVEHARHRRRFAAPFRPAQVLARFGAGVEHTVGRLVGVIEGEGRAELRRDVAGPLAVAVVADCLGLPQAEPATVLGWYTAIVSAVTAGGEVTAEATAAFAALRAHVEQAIVDGDPSSLIAQAARADTGLGLAGVVSDAAVLMFGGIETTEGMILNLVWHLLSRPDQLALVLADRSLLAGAIEESLRLEPAAAVVDRYATRDVVLDGVPIKAGDLVVASIAGANRDPAVFAEPGRFDLARRNASAHLAFAHGPHYCLGVELARLQTRVVVDALLTRLPGLRADPRHRDLPRGLIFRKPPALWVRWDPGTPRSQ